MTIWLDAHLPPAIASWLKSTFGVESISVRDLGLRDAQDPPIFAEAKAAHAVVMTKDSDFAEMVERMGPPPQVLWLRCGNTSNAALRQLLTREMPDAIARLNTVQRLIELGVDDE